MAIPSVSKGIPLSRKQSTNQAFEGILQHNFNYMVGWAPVAYSREGIEGVHQVRVAFRRMRSALVLFRKAIPREITDSYGVEMKWIAGELGPARDLDVFIDEGLEAMAGKIPLVSGEKKMMDLAIQHRDRAYEKVRALMDGKRYQTFITGFEEWVKNHGWYQEEMPGATRKKLGHSVQTYAVITMKKRLSKVLLAGERLEEMSDEELHQLRIECKKLRYATEFFNALFDKESMGRFTLQLKGVQGLLGVLNDVAVMPGLLDSLLEGVDDPEVIQYAGALIGWRARQFEEVRGLLSGHWSVFSRTAIPWES